MRGERITSLRNPWFTASIGITAAIAIVAAIAGFTWLPLEQQGERFNGVWNAICSAAGLVRNAPSAAQIVRGDYPMTRVEIVPQMLQGASAESIGRGATLALRCTMCHGARGLSQADSLNLSDSDMRDLAAYYAYLPRPSDHPPIAGVRPRIVANGAPMRGIAPCGACHGDLDSKAGAGWLRGQPAVYLRAQLEAFSSGARRNDIGEQMRDVARDDNS